MQRLTKPEEIEEARRALVELLEAREVWLCTSHRGAAIELRPRECELCVRHNSLLLYFHDEGGECVRRIIGWKLDGAKLILETTQRMGAERAILELIPRTDTSTAKAAVAAARRAACERLAALACELMPGTKAVRIALSAGARRAGALCTPYPAARR